jgi:pimeloyl-ACP methyl ester carboxylesterase
MPTTTLDSTTALHYGERGDAKAKHRVVLLHGFPLDSRIWDNVLAPPPADVRVITPDMTGFGKSRSDKSFTMESLADDIHTLLVKLNICPVVLGGLSMGGYVALAYAKKYPMDLEGLLLIDTRAEADGAEGKTKRNAMLEMIRQRGADAPKAVADQMMPVMIAKDRANDQAFVASVRLIMQSCSAKTIENAVVALRDRNDQTESMPSIAIPTLILVGDQDAITPPSAAQAMNKAIPQSKLVMVPGSGHLSSMEKPQQVQAAIIDFVKTL